MAGVIDESGIGSESELLHHSQDEDETMGKLIVTEFVALDGVAQAPGGPDEDRDGDFTHGRWQAPFGDEEAGSVIFEQARTMDALLLGRRTDEIFACRVPKLRRRFDLERHGKAR